MPAGTITLTNGSTAVTGSGTSFTTELKANDFVVAVVGGVTYTLGVQAIGSATGLTLTTAYNGPTTSGLAWTAVPNAALVGITAQVAADVAKAIRGFNFDKVNWQKIFSNDASVTVTRPDLTSFTGPSWGYLSGQLSAGFKVRGQIPSGGIDFNTYGPTADYEGVWYLSSTAQVTGSSNMPEANIGILEVFRGGAFQGYQRYSSRYGAVYTRTLTATWSAASPNVWTDWFYVGMSSSGVAQTVDVNTLINAGRYACNSGSANLPVSYAGTMQVERYNNNATTIQQTFKTQVSAAAGANRTFTRSLTSGAWTAWAESLTANNIGTSGAFIPLMSAANTWAGAQTFTANVTAQNAYLVSSGARAASPANGSAQFGGRLRMSYSNVSGRYTDFYIQENVGTNVTQYLLLQADTSTSRIWSFVSDGNAFAQGTWQSSSDKRIKTNINVIDDPLDKMRKIRGYSWERLDGVSPGRGFIAQEVQDVFPEAVIEGGNTELKDGSTVEKTLSVDVAGVAASLHHEAILALMDKLEEKDAVIAELQKRMKAIDGLDA